MRSMLGYDVIYKERIYHCISLDICFVQEDINAPRKPNDQPKLITLVCINDNQELVVMEDETFMFRFIKGLSRKEGQA